MLLVVFGGCEVVGCGVVVAAVPVVVVVVVAVIVVKHHQPSATRKSYVASRTS